MKTIVLRTSESLSKLLEGFPDRLALELSQRGSKLEMQFVQGMRGWDILCGDVIFPDPSTRKFSNSKITFQHRLRDLGLRFLLTLPMDDNFAFLSEALGLPFVAKPDSGSNGRGITLVRGEAAFQEARRINCNIAQEYVPGGNQDYRFTVIGGKVVAAIQRVAKAGDFRANIALGADYRKYVPTPQQISEVENVAKLVGIPIGGFDVFKSGLVGEVNLGATFTQTEHATKINVIGALADYLIQRSAL